MDHGGAQIVGAKELIKELRSLGVEVEDLKRPFADIARRTAVIASGLAPKRTGRLAASVRGSKTQNRASISSGSKRVPYAGPINYGWPKRNIKGDLFMQKASLQMQPIAVEEIQAELQRLIREKRLS